MHFIPEEDREPEPQHSHPTIEDTWVAAVLERVAWGDAPFLYAGRMVTDDGGSRMAISESYGTARVVADVIGVLAGLGLTPNAPAKSATAADPGARDATAEDIDELALWLRDLADHVRFADPPHGLGHEALIGHDANVMMAYRNAMARHGQSLGKEIAAARDVLIAWARKHPAPDPTQEAQDG
jgi:hypothetical protein